MLNIIKRIIVGNPDGQTLFQRIMNKKEKEFAPLNLHTGDVFQLDLTSDMILAENSDFLFKIDSENKAIVSYISEIHINEMTSYRIYCKTFNSEEEFFIDVSYKNNRLLGISLFNLYEEMGLVESYSEPVTPDRKAALNHWLGKGMIGDNTFILDKYSYGIYISKIIETEIFKERENVTHTAAYYGRNVDSSAFSGRELCLVRLSEDSDEAWLSIYLGVELSQSQIKLF